MTKQEFAVLMALRDNPGGLLADDFREATKREVSRHNTAEHLAVLLSRGMITTTAEQSTDGRIRGMVDRYRLAELGAALMESEAVVATATG